MPQGSRRRCRSHSSAPAEAPSQLSSTGAFVYGIAAVSELPAVQTVLILIELVVAVALVVVVLLQRSEGGALGMGGGSGFGNLFSPRGAGDLLTRTTAILAA